MGSQVRASCPCGYDEKFIIGGDRHSYRKYSYFPYHCSVCGIVEVNVAAKRAKCPNSADHEVTRIGGSLRERIAHTRAYAASLLPRKISFLERVGLFSPKPSPPIDQPPERRVVCQWEDHEIYNLPYKCPECGQITMQFKSTGLRFD